MAGAGPHKSLPRPLEGSRTPRPHRLLSLYTHKHFQNQAVVTASGLAGPDRSAGTAITAHGGPHSGRRVHRRYPRRNGVSSPESHRRHGETVSKPPQAALTRLRYSRLRAVLDERVTAEMRIPAVYFSVFSPVMCGYIFHPSSLWNQEIIAEELAAPPGGFPCSAILFRLYEARNLLVMYRGIPGHVIPTYRLAKSLQGCVAIAVKSCFKEENKYIRFSQRTIGVPVLSVGPLMPAAKSVSDNGEGSDLVEWLDRQRPSSIVFVSFGSETFLLREQAPELKAGIEIERGGDGSFLSENIVTTLRMVMVGEESKKLRSKAAEARNILLSNTQRQQSYIHGFIQQVEQIAVEYKQKKLNIFTEQ